MVGIDVRARDNNITALGKNIDYYVADFLTIGDML